MVKVVVLHGHGACLRTWSYLSSSWRDYGNAQINITWLRKFSLDDLVLMDPDIIVLSDAAGNCYQFTLEEREIIFDYVLNKRRDKPVHLLGTYLFYYESRDTVYDNRALLPLFGLDEHQMYISDTVHDDKLEMIRCGCRVCIESYNGSLVIPGCTRCIGINPEFGKVTIPVGMPKGWLSDTACTIQPQLLQMVPGTRVELLAKNQTGDGVIFRYIGEKHTAIYVSFLPEFRARKQDVQLLYNLMLHLVKQKSPILTLESLCIREAAKHAEKLREQIALVPYDLQDRIAAQEIK